MLTISKGSFQLFDAFARKEIKKMKPFQIMKPIFVTSLMTKFVRMLVPRECTKTLSHLNKKNSHLILSHPRTNF